MSTPNQAQSGIDPAANAAQVAESKHVPPGDELARAVARLVGNLAAIAERAHPGLVEDAVHAAVVVGQQHEVVLRAVALEEGVGHE